VVGVRSHPEDDLLMAPERWAPADAERWTRFRGSLTPADRTDVLLPLQAALAGLVAFRDGENQPVATSAEELRPQLQAVHQAYAWALGLVSHLQEKSNWERYLAPAGAHGSNPESSLEELSHALAESLRLSDRLSGLPTIDAGIFHASCDVFLRELERNAFFRPPEPLEFANVRELVHRASIPPANEPWTTAAAKLTSWVSLLALIRGHRYLGIADRQIAEEDGLYRAHIVVAAVRRELRMLTSFLMAQGVDAFTDELRAKARSVDELDELRESVEAIAMGIHAKAHAALGNPLPDPSSTRGHALPAERMRSGIRELRATVKDAAKTLRELGRPATGERPNRASERLQKNLEQDIWGFRFILRAFVAKASAIGEGSIAAAKAVFAEEFVAHFRLFGPRLSRATGYARRAQLIDAITTLSDCDEIRAAELETAVRECTSFLEHLDRALDGMPHSLLAPFDKEKAAAELRGYLAAARDQGIAERVRKHAS